jgi:TetR/AcrR family transcriptional repressor of nem operon
VRSSRDETEKHRQEIIDASSHLFREKGAEAVSVPELMRAVGMTHGGFYKHFSSKDELVSTAYDKAFDQIVEHLGKEIQGHHDDHAAAWRAIVTSYLSTVHRDNPAKGCAAAALAGDAARLVPDSPAQEAFERGIRRMLDQTASLQDGPDAYAKGMVALSTLIGALLLARGTTGELSDAFLASAREQLLKPEK